MFKQSSVVFLYAETSVHLGGGASLGAIDLAIQRERYTDFPVGASSGIKGAVRDWFEDFGKSRNVKADDHWGEKITLTFGPENDSASEHAGAASFTDARILLFPVKSLKGVFAWITCPLVLERFKRDLTVAGVKTDWTVPAVDQHKVLGTNENQNKTNEGRVVLEEFTFTFESHDSVSPIAEWLKTNAMPNGDEYKFWKDNLHTHLLLVSDDDFKDFVKHSTEVQARVKLNKQKTTTGKDGNLFYQENLPSDSLMYSLVFAQPVLGDKVNGWGLEEEVMGFVKKLDAKRIQIGGNESTGKGIMCVRFLDSPNPSGQKQKEDSE
ncbi:MAG: type III-B CRISPR module RAMP protein Cmr4 [Bacteroidota bacterium]